MDPQWKRKRKARAFAWIQTGIILVASALTAEVGSFVTGLSSLHRVAIGLALVGFGMCFYGIHLAPREENK